MAEVLYEEDSEEESESEDEEVQGKINELHETIKALTQQNKQLESVLTKLEIHLEESLLSNAKLLYQNRTLSDASLNERQKSKIVEAISNAESPKEAKNLHETLKATVGSTPNSNKGPQSLSESVNRRSNLSSMLNSRQNINESKTADNPMKDMMQRLAGIKK
jgi:myosin heavy subunit